MKTPHLFALFFLLTGIFAMVGGIFTWGEGWVFSQAEGLAVLIPLADVLCAGPVSLLAALGLFRNKKWGLSLGLLGSGMYLFGSVQVYILIAWGSLPLRWEIFLPPVVGLSFCLVFVRWVLLQPASGTPHG
ncbi:MAG: hypothetical protein AAFR61_11710 [Bacteroidota bacterium]